MTNSIFGPFKRVTFTLVLLLLTTWARAPLADLPALFASPQTLPKASALLHSHTKNIKKVALATQLEHKAAVKAYAFACATALEMDTESLSLAAAKKAYHRLANLFNPDKAGINTLTAQVFTKIFQTINEAYSYLMGYLKHVELLKRKMPAPAPSLLSNDLPSFQDAADHIAAHLRATAATPAVITTTRPRQKISRTAPARTSASARPSSTHRKPKPRVSQSYRRTNPPKTSSKKYELDAHSCWWVTIRNYKFMLVNEAGQFKFPALCRGSAATFSDHRAKTNIQPFPLTKDERSLVFSVLIKAGISYSTITKTLKNPDILKKEVKEVARKVSGKKIFAECAICYENRALHRFKCATSDCKPPRCCSSCLRKITKCPYCRQPSLKN